MKKEWTLSLILAMALAGIICSDGFEYSRTIYDGELSDSGHSWAGYAKHCEGDKFALIFSLKNLTGGVQANLNLNDSNRYAVGFINLENGSLATYLFRQEMGNVEHFLGKMINYDPSATYQVEISSGEGEVQVFMAGVQDDEAVKVIDYFDNDPLPAGAIDFETLEHSSVNLREVNVNCEMPTEQETPNLGVGYFKPPN
jgi:hypothetical protein